MKISLDAATKKKTRQYPRTARTTSCHGGLLLGLALVVFVMVHERHVLYTTNPSPVNMTPTITAAPPAPTTAEECDKPVITTEVNLPAVEVGNENNNKKDEATLQCLKEVLWNDLPIFPQPTTYPDGRPRTVINGKNQEIQSLGAIFAHHGDAGNWRRWNQGIAQARGQPIPALTKPPCTVWEVGAHTEATASAEHMKTYPLCDYHAYEPVPSYAEKLRQRWASEPRMHVHAYGLASQDASFQVSTESLHGEATFLGDSPKGGGAEDTTSTSTASTAVVKSFDFALSEAAPPTLLDVNCEGCEYDFLLQAIEHGFLAKVSVILISWHGYGGIGAKVWQLCEVRTALTETHKMIFGFAFGWERWVLKEG